jgi:hypothetical protein
MVKAFLIALFGLSPLARRKQCRSRRFISPMAWSRKFVWAAAWVE